MEKETLYPTLIKRVQSTFIDALVILGAMFGLAEIIDRVGEVPGWTKAILFFGLWVIYEPLAVSLGATVGNLVMNIRVRSMNDNKKRINILQAFLRYIIKMALGWISFLTIHSNKEKRAIHDFVAGSVMVER